MSIFSNDNEGIIFSVRAGNTEIIKKENNKILITPLPIKGLLCITKNVYI